ncbi:hypothetical protein ACNQVK_25980 [Mycobacterium sp. 134]|uniref:DUF7832 domain-containing protein n=1 Tax=Mycobacterium sp. 134 TaxID=3400425 RepID=UPI003AADCB6D
MTYDDAGWHYDTAIENGLQPAAAGTHIGMFMAWLALHGMAQPDYAPSELHERTITPGEYLRRHCVAQIDPFMLTDTGNAFTSAAYRPYLRQYRDVPAVARHDSTYETPDTWDTYDEVAVLIDALYAEWRSAIAK